MWTITLINDNEIFSVSHGNFKQLTDAVTADPNIWQRGEEAAKKNSSFSLSIFSLYPYTIYLKFNK